MAGTKAGAAKARAKRATLPPERVGESLVLISGVDTLNVHMAGRLAAQEVETLRDAKEEALRRHKTEDPRPVTWTAEGLRFEVKHHASKRGPILLENEALALTINPDAPRPLPTVLAEVRSLFLWQRGYKEAGQVVEKIFASLAAADDVPALEVSRVDLCADWQGWEPTAAMRDQLFTRAHDRHLHYSSMNHFTGYSFGAGGAPLMARIYDKRTEAVVSGKENLMEELWQTAEGYRFADCPRCGPLQRVDVNEMFLHANPREIYVQFRDGKAVRRGRKPERPRKVITCKACGGGQEVSVVPVWRLEFQIRREALREAGVLDKDGEVTQHYTEWNTAKEELGALWQYLGNEWLTWRLPRTKTERVRVRPEWRELVDGASFDRSTTADVVRAKRFSESKRTVDQLAGYIARGVAELWTLEGKSTFEKTLPQLLSDARGRAIEKGTTLADRAEELYKVMKTTSDALNSAAVARVRLGQ